MLEGTDPKYGEVNIPPAPIALSARVSNDPPIFDRKIFSMLIEDNL